MGELVDCLVETGGIRVGYCLFEACAAVFAAFEAELPIVVGCELFSRTKSSVSLSR